MDRSEQDIRLDILNTLLKTPHRKLDQVWPVHQPMIKQDPLFYQQLAAWYADKGEVRDHKEVFAASLCLSHFEGHRDVGLALVRQMPPYQVARVVDFIHGRKTTKKVRERVGRGKTATTRERVVTEQYGLFKNVPRSLKTEVARYLREREADDAWFASSVMQARKSIKRMYAILHITPSDLAQAALFDKTPPEDSALAAVKRLHKAQTPADQAQIIMDYKVPYRVASTVIKAMTPTVVLALVDTMSNQELINNMSSLRKRGALDNTQLKELISARLDAAKKDKRVAAIKAAEAAKVAGVSAEVTKQLEDVADTQVKAKGRIRCPTAILIDKSGSMHQAIEVGKRVAALISAISESELYVYACDTMAYSIQSKGSDLASWDKAFQGINAGGATSCGVGIEFMRRQKQRVEQIIMITDEGENSSPPFLTSMKNYIRDVAGDDLRVVFLKCGHASDMLEQRCANNGIDYDAYDFNGDYYSLPNLIPLLTKGSRLDLLMEIMLYQLPQRQAL